MKFFLVVIFSLLSTTFAYSSEIYFPDFEKELTQNGVGSHYSKQSFNNLILFLNKEIGTIKSKNPDSKKSQNLIGRLDTVLTAISELEAQGSTGDKVSAFRNLKSLAYSLAADTRVVSKSGGIGVDLGNVLGGQLKLPYATPQNRNLKLTSTQAALEAYNLVDPISKKEYSSPQELAGLTIEQISRLDVREDNPLWYTEEQLNYIKQKFSSPWEYLEKRIENSATQAVGTNYSLDRARRILVYDEIKETATSPKVNTKDLYGQSWKLKWGEEIHSESINNRLYVNLGSKFSDLVYTNQGGKKDLILVLNAKTKENLGEQTCEKIATVEKFKNCLKSSVYKFNVSPYIISKGTITDELWNNSDLNFSNSPKTKEDFLGREYIVFSESLVEYQPSYNVAARLGATPFSTINATDDRVKRGLAVFSYWIRNKDPKDDNNRGIIFENQYLEFMHDLGASLANIQSSSHPNQLDTIFATIEKGQVVYDMSVLYKPAAFSKATLADQLWMAHKILSLSYEEIKQAVDASNWPEFQKINMLSRIIARRNNLQTIYEIDQPMSLQTIPSAEISLKTKDDRLAAIREFGIAAFFKGDENKALSCLEGIMNQSRARVDSKGSSRHVDKVFSMKENVVVTAACDRSVLVSILEKTVRPTGLSRRVSRRRDGSGLSACYPGLERRQVAVDIPACSTGFVGR